MVLNVKRFKDEGGKGVDAVKECFGTEMLSDSLFKTWTVVHRIPAGIATLRVRDDAGGVIDKGVLRIEEATYLIRRPDYYTDIFSMSVDSLEACGEVMVSAGIVTQVTPPIFRQFDDDSLIERISLYDAGRKQYIRVIYDKAITKADFYRSTEGERCEVQDFVFRLKKRFVVGSIRLSTLGVYGDRWALALVDQSTERGVRLEAEREKLWARDASQLVGMLFADPQSAVR